MTQVVDSCNSSKELVLLFNSPVIKTDKKLAIIKEVFANLSPLSLSFVELITKKEESL